MEKPGDGDGGGLARKPAPAMREPRRPGEAGHRNLPSGLGGERRNTRGASHRDRETHRVLR